MVDIDVAHWPPATLARASASEVDLFLRKALFSSGKKLEEVNGLAEHVLASHLLVARTSSGTITGLCTFQVADNMEPAALIVETLISEQTEDLYRGILALDDDYPEGVYVPASGDSDRLAGLKDVLDNLGFTNVHLHEGEQFPIPYFHVNRKG